MNSIDQFYSEIKRYPLLTPTQELELARQVQEMLRLKALDRKLTRLEQKRLRVGERAKATMIKSNMRLVTHLAAKQAARGRMHLEMLDLVQEGSVGLMRAVELFDPARGYKFSTYAYWWIKQSMSRGIMHTEYAIRRSTKVVELEYKLKKLVLQMQESLGRNPTLAELAAGANTSVQEIETIQQRGGHCVSLDVKIAGAEESGATTLEDLMQYEDPEEPFDRDLVRDTVLPLLPLLDERERTAITLRFGLMSGQEETLQQIGTRLGISRENCRKLINKALRKLTYALRQRGIYEDLRALATSA